MQIFFSSLTVALYIIYQTCQEIITLIPHRMKKHISLSDPIERPAHDPVPGIETEL